MKTCLNVVYFVNICLIKINNSYANIKREKIFNKIKYII